MGCLAAEAIASLTTGTSLAKGTSGSQAGSSILSHLVSLDPTGRTISAIDQNHDGRLDASEIALYARSQGLDAGKATEEFIGLDANRDGLLDANELSDILGSGVPAAPVKMGQVVSVPSHWAPVAPVIPAQPIVQADPTTRTRPPPAIQRSMSATALGHSTSRSQPRSNILSRLASLDPAWRTIGALDQNQDGRLDASEIAHYAHTQGVDTSKITQDFAGLDGNGDGLLDANELSGILGAGMSAAPATMEQVASVPPHGAPAASTFFAQPVTQLELAPSARPPAPPIAQVVAMTQPLTHTKSTAAVAEEDASVIAMQLSQQEHQQSEALELDHKAAELRANGKSVARSAVQNAMTLSATTARTKAQELLRSLVELEDKAERAEVKAAALRAKSKAELKEANDLMAVVDVAMSSQAL